MHYDSSIYAGAEEWADYCESNGVDPDTMPDDEDDEPFTLSSTPAPRRKPAMPPVKKEKQRAFGWTNELPGQQHLTD